MAKDRNATPSTHPGSAFIDAARALGCDEDEGRWEATLRTIARQKPKEPGEGEAPEPPEGEAEKPTD